MEMLSKLKEDYVYMKMSKENLGMHIRNKPAKRRACLGKSSVGDLRLYLGLSRCRQIDENLATIR